MAVYLQPLSPDPAVSRGPHHVRGLRGAARAGDLPAVPRGAGGARGGSEIICFHWILFGFIEFMLHIHNKQTMYCIALQQ